MTVGYPAVAAKPKNRMALDEIGGGTWQHAVPGRRGFAPLASRITCARRASDGTVDDVLSPPNGLRRADGW
jgi:hypothetical protein